jgi:RND family efflux transporter MFP subunit
MSRIDRFHGRRPSVRGALAALAAAALAALAAACGASAAAERPAESPAVVLAADDVAAVEEQRVLDGPVVSGTLAPAARAEVRAEVGGAVTATFAEPGTAVAAGALLARIDDRTQRAAHASALAEVRGVESAAAAAERRAARQEMLLAAGAVSAEEAEEAREGATAAQARVMAARSRLAAAAAELAHATVRAPIAGVVSARAVAAGEAVQPGAVLFEVLDPTSMRLEAAVPAAQIATIHVGAPVRFIVTGYPGRTFAGRVERVSPAADPATRQLPVVVTIDNRDRRLVAGLFAEGRVASAERRALVVPDAALDGSGARPTVLRLTNGRLVAVTVAPGPRHADRGVVEIVAGLRRGDTVLVGAAQGITSGTAARLAAPPSHLSSR